MTQEDLLTKLPDKREDPYAIRNHGEEVFLGHSRLSGNYRTPPRGLGITVVTGHRYLGGYIGDGEAERGWTKDKIQGWTESVKILTRVAPKHPQSAYAGLQKSLQQEWAFVQRVAPGRIFTEFIHP